MGRGLLLVWKAARGWTIAWGILLLVQGLIPAAQIYLTKLTIDLLADAAGKQAGMAVLARVWVPAALIALLWMAGQLLASVIKRVREAQAELVQDSIHSLIQSQALALDVAFYENPDSYDLLHRARVDAISQPVALLENFGTFIQNGLTIAVLAVMLAGYAFWLPLLLIFSALPGLWAVGRSVLRQHQWRIRNTANERRARHYDWLITDRNSVAEMRLFDLGGYHQELFRRMREKLRNGRLGLARDEMKAELGAGVVAWLGGLAGMVWILLRVSRGLARLGDVVLCYQAFQQGQKLMRSLMESTGRIYRSLLFLDNLFEFLAIRPELCSKSDTKPLPVPLQKGIGFEGVTFCYPGSEHAALDNFSLTIPSGQVTAIVGHNGAGKSTLIKLLCRFYDPQQGGIRLDGVDLRDLDIAELRKQIAVLFQEPVHYHASAADNIAMGDRTPDPDALRIRNAAEAAGAAEIIAKLPRGYETVLGKWFGGAELSVGEWQRIALARAFLRDAEIIMLDEPTSAMDSWAEADWLSRFRELTAGHTALAITHRFTTAMHADMIHVMVDGRIMESGTHTELAAAGGLYAVSWREQMKEAGYGG